MITIDIDMPENCHDCPCFDYEYDECQITKNSPTIENINRRLEDCPLKEAKYYDGQRLKPLRGQTYTIEITKRPNAQRLKMFLAQLKVYISSRQRRGADQDQKIEEYWNGAYWAIAQIEIHLEQESAKELNHGRE